MFAVGLALAPVGADAAFPGANGRIAFLSVRANGGLELYAMNDDGTAVDHLTAHAPLVWQGPAWSPDGRTIAVVHSYDNRVMAVDVSSGRPRLLPVPIFTTAGIAWSPNGRQLVYGIEGADGTTHLWVAHADGRAPQRLTSGSHWDLSPAWSPGGKRIAFRRLGDSLGGEIVTVRIDGRGVRRLGRGGSPSWSPDGRRVVFSSSSGTRSVIRIVDADGSSRRTLVSDTRCDFGAPAWSRRGRIAFVAACDDGSSAIQAVAADGHNRRTLINGQFYSFSEHVLSWSPDGTKFAYVTEGEVRVAAADGSDGRSLFPLPAGATHAPAWSPDGRRLAAEVWPATTSKPPELIDSPVGEPAWSPDGRSLIGIRGEAGTDVVVIDLVSGDERLIYQDEGIGYVTLEDPAWSPTGGLIAFAVGDTGTLVLYDVGSGDFVPFAYRGPGRHPAWSPDGRQLAFDTGSGQARLSIFTVGSNGAGARRIARDASQPAWSPDGRKIVFVRTVARGNTELFVMNADGSKQRRLTFNRGADVEPDWQPVPGGS